MIVGLGVDVFEVSRMEQALREGDPDFHHGLFTNDEIAYCQRQRHPAAHYAVRFALKEAIFKALALDDASGASSPGWTSYRAFPSCRFGLRRSHRTRWI